MKHDLPVVVAHAEDVAVVADIHEQLARALLFLARQVGQQVEAIDVVLVGAADGLVALLALLDDVGLAGHREEGREPVVVLDDLGRDLAGFDLAGPAHQQRNAERAFPVRVLFASGTASCRRPAMSCGAVRCRSSTARTCRRRCRARRGNRASGRRSCRGRSWCRDRATASGRPDAGSPSWCA